MQGTGKQFDDGCGATVLVVDDDTVITKVRV